MLCLTEICHHKRTAFGNTGRLSNVINVLISKVRYIVKKCEEIDSLALNADDLINSSTYILLNKNIN